MESSFFVAEDALRRLEPDIDLNEADILMAFDLQRDLIYATAARIYARAHKGSRDLVAADF